jgi:hypothetical protein
MKILVNIGAKSALFNVDHISLLQSEEQLHLATFINISPL